jgi:hypothetical protein
MTPAITGADVEKARVAYEAHETRDLFYRAATDLVDLALRRATSLALAEELVVGRIFDPFGIRQPPQACLPSSPVAVRTIRLHRGFASSAYSDEAEQPVRRKPNG